jgi:amino acid transporter
VTLGFIVAAVGSAFAGLCYAEFASMIPMAGSAYTYAYATMGELAAWIIGWDLILEYAIGAATVGIAWSEYFNKLLRSSACTSLRVVPLAARERIDTRPASCRTGSSTCRRCSSSWC